MLPLVSSTVNVELIEEEQDTGSTGNKQPSLVMEEECVFKGILFTIVVFYHVNWLEWLRVVSAKPHKAFEELPLVLVETLGHRMDCLSRVKRVMRLDDVRSHKEKEIDLLAQVVLNDSLSSDSIKSVELLLLGDVK